MGAAVAVESAKARALHALKISGLFERAARATRDAALHAAEIAHVDGGDVIAAQGAPLGSILLLGRGRASLERRARGDRVVPLGYRGAGDLLGEAGVAGAMEHRETATAMEPVELVKIDVAVVRDLLAADANLGAAFLAVVLERRRETEERIESLLSRNVESRVCEFLVKAAARWGIPSPRGTLISAPLTHLEIAQSIGSTRETVTLTLGALKRASLVDTAGHRLILRDREALTDRAKR